MGATVRLFHLSLNFLDWKFLGLVFTFFICFRIFCIQYGGGSFLALVQRTKFFFKWILSRDQGPHQPSAGAGRGASHRSRMHSRSSRAGQARLGSRGLSRARSEAAVEETRLLLEASMIEFCGTQWDLLSSSCTVCRLVSRTVSAVLPELIRMLKAKAAAGSDILWG